MFKLNPISKSAIILGGALFCLAPMAASAGIAKPAEDINLGNWMQPENNKWSFQNLTQLTKTAVVSRGTGPVSPLEYNIQSLDDVTFNGVTLDGKKATLRFGDYLKDVETDAIVILKDGKIVFERYSNGMTPQQRHWNMSVTKSFTGTMAAQLMAEGRLDESKLITHYLPEFKGTDLGKVTVRHLADMTAGFLMSEDFTDKNADIYPYGYANTLIKRPEGYKGPANVHEYALTIKTTVEPGKQFHYATPLTEVLAELVRRVTGKPDYEVLSDMIWSKIGAEHDALMIVDDSGRGLGSSGLISTARDLARFGQMILQHGTYNGHQIVDSSLTDDFIRGADPEVFVKWAKEHAPTTVGFSYRNQWWVTHNEHGAFSALGIFGQMIYIDPKANMVVVKLASQAKANDPIEDENCWPALHAVAKELMK